VVRIWFEKGGGDLVPPAGFPRLRIHQYGASSGAPAFGTSWPCFFESRYSSGNQIRPTLASGFAQSYARVLTQFTFDENGV